MGVNTGEVAMNGTHAGSHLSHRALLALGVLLACLAGFLFAGAPAFAGFSRPYLTQITGTPTGPLGEQVPFGYVECIAIDTKQGGPGSVWVGQKVGEGGNTPLIDEFSASNVFVSQLTGLPTHSCAFDDSNEKLYTVGTSEYVAVDNSTGPYAGDIYFGHDGSGSITEPGGLRRETPAGAAVPFTCPEGIAARYINKYGELVGRPGEGGGPAEPELWYGGNLGGVAIDSSNGGSAGDIYVINNRGLASLEVEEFTPAGCFVRAITGHVEVSSGGGKKEVELFADALSGVAVDPTDGDVLVTSIDPGSLGSEGVYEFNSSGEYLGEIAGTPNKRFERERAFQGGGIAVSSSGELYVGVHEEEEVEGGSAAKKEVVKVAKEVVDVFGAGAYYPDAVTGGVTDNQSAAGTVTLKGVVRGVKNAEGKSLGLTECEFEYVTEKAFAVGGFGGAAVTPCVLESGSSPVGQMLEEENYPVHVAVGGLVSGEVYEYRLVAGTGAGERGGTQDGAVESFAAAAVPAVRAVSVGNVSSSFVDFHAEVDPRGSATTYEFQYVDAVGYEAAVAQHAPNPYAAGGSVPVPAAGVGSGDGYVSVSVQAAGLSPGTVYHYRVVASNGVGVSEGADGVFSTVPTGPSDGRVFELVTPANKGDAEDMFGKVGLAGGIVNTDQGYASEDGDHFLLVTDAAFGPFPASGQGAYVFSRNEAKRGWEFQSVISPTLAGQALANQTLEGLVFDPVDFSMVGVEDLATVSQESRQVDLAGPPGSSSYASVASGTEAVPAELVGASRDVSRVVVRDEDHGLPLCEKAQEGIEKGLDGGSNGLYEWSAVRRCLSLVDVKSQSEGGGLVSHCGAQLGLGGAPVGVGHGAVSADGSKIFFTAPDPGNEGRGQLTGPGCWQEGTTINTPQLYMRLGGTTTVEVSAPAQGVNPPATYSAMYVGASEDGSKVFFMTKTELTKDAVELKTTAPELYEYDSDAPEADRLVRVSRGDLKSGPVEGRVLNVPAVSADGSSVYFNAEGNLTPEAHEGGLYRYDTETGETTYVAPPQSYPEARLERGGFENPLGRWYAQEVIDKYVAGLDLEAGYYTTRDGGFLLFGPYRYDAADNSTVCVMCNPDGSGPIPDATFTRSEVAHANPAGGPQRGMSENGEYVFFDTTVPLVPRATNGMLDVYQWHDGAISLVSSGVDSSNSYFLDSSSYVNAAGETVEGGNVFFGSHANLVPSQNTESEGNLYDARIGGGFATSTGTGPCEGDACANPPPAPADPTATLLAAPAALVSPAPSPPPAKRVTKKTVKCKKIHGKKKSHSCAKAKRAKRAKRSDHGRTR
jgi:hypothetical protein